MMVGLLAAGLFVPDIAAAADVGPVNEAALAYAIVDYVDRSCPDFISDRSVLDAKLKAAGIQADPFASAQFREEVDNSRVLIHSLAVTLAGELGRKGNTCENIYALTSKDVAADHRLVRPRVEEVGAPVDLEINSDTLVLQHGFDSLVHKTVRVTNGMACFRYEDNSYRCVRENRNLIAVVVADDVAAQWKRRLDQECYDFKVAFSNQRCSFTVLFELDRTNSNTFETANYFYTTKAYLQPFCKLSGFCP